MMVDALALSSHKQVEPNERVPMKMLGQNEFLQLLVTQMRNQDPLSPMQDTEFIAQMAQFTSLEQSRQMRDDMKELKNREGFQQAVGLMGQTVTVKVNEEENLTGVVSEVRVKDGEATLLINDKSFTLQNVIEVHAKDGAAKTVTQK